MYGMNPYTYSGAQAAPNAGFPLTSLQMTSPQMISPQMMGVPMRAVVPQVQQSYVEDILRMNRGKVATIYTTNENNPQWAAKVFKGRVENAARDHVVLSDTETGMRYMILMVNIDYITFDEPLRFEPGIYPE